jgi:hypothetical protein
LADGTAQSGGLLDIDGGVRPSGLGGEGKDTSEIDLFEEWLLGTVRFREASI